MFLELAGAYAIFLLALFVYAELFKKPALAVIAAVLIFPLGAWILGDGLQIQIGEMTTMSGDIEGIGATQGESESTVAGNETSTEYNESTEITYYPDTTEITGYMYADIPVTPYIPFSDLIGLLCFLFGLYALFHYAIKSMDRQ